MSLRLVVEPGAARDIEEACEWYDERLSGLGNRFIESLDSVFELLIENPTAFPLVSNGIRKSATKSFPYLVFYLTEETSVHILAVIHAAQDPTYIASRLDR